LAGLAADGLAARRPSTSAGSDADGWAARCPITSADLAANDRRARRWSTAAASTAAALAVARHPSTVAEVVDGFVEDEPIAQLDAGGGGGQQQSHRQCAKCAATESVQSRNSRRSFSFCHRCRFLWALRR